MSWLRFDSRQRSLLIVAFFILIATSAASAGWQEDEQLRQEEAVDYYEKWLKEDVVYIITPEERATFEKLTTDEEREQFIEQFWYRRDSDPRTSVNEFKVEHYRRIAFVNERYGSGKPGWRTDRGRIYIVHGPPDQVEPHRAGGPYQRPTWEGGGTTVTFPFEIWRYRYIEGLGQDIELEFVDPSYSGEYKLAVDPFEKDAFRNVPGLGRTEAEMMGWATRAERYDSNYPIFRRRRDSPFEKYYTYNRIQAAPDIKYRDLQEVVKVDLSYNDLTIEIRSDGFDLNDEQALLPVTVEVQNKDLTFQEENGMRVAKVAVYGVVTSLTNRVVAEFEDEMTNSFTAEQLGQAVKGSSLYQKILPLDKRMRYRLDLVVKDLNSGRMAVRRQALIPPAFNDTDLQASSVVLSDFIRILEEAPDEDQMFILGDVWIRPSLNRVFNINRPIGLYFQLYNLSFDQSTLEPALTVNYEVRRDGQTVWESVDKEGKSIQFFSERRTVLIRDLPVDQLVPGAYQVVVKATDRITDQTVTVADRFEITG